MLPTLTIFFRYLNILYSKDFKVQVTVTSDKLFLYVGIEY